MWKLKEVSVTCRSQESARGGRSGEYVNIERLRTFSRAKALAKDHAKLDFICLHKTYFSTSFLKMTLLP